MKKEISSTAVANHTAEPPARPPETSRKNIVKVIAPANIKHADRQMVSASYPSKQAQERNKRISQERIPKPPASKYIPSKSYIITTALKDSKETCNEM